MYARNQATLLNGSPLPKLLPSVVFPVLGPLSLAHEPNGLGKKKKVWWVVGVHVQDLKGLTFHWPHLTAESWETSLCPWALWTHKSLPQEAFELPIFTYSFYIWILLLYSQIYWTSALGQAYWTRVSRDVLSVCEGEAAQRLEAWALELESISSNPAFISF